MTRSTTNPGQHKTCWHTGEPVRVGPFCIYPTGTMYGDPYKLALELGDVDSLIPLKEWEAPEDCSITVVEGLALPDFGGVPPNWEELLFDLVVQRLLVGEKIVPFCTASRGRTGTFIASLIALLEPDVQDPIAAARERHCHHAVETEAQGRGVFALRGEALPEGIHFQY